MERTWSSTPARPEPMSRADRDAVAVLLSVHGLGPLTLGRLVERLGSPAAVLDVATQPRATVALVEASRATDGEARPMPANVAAGIILAAARRATILAEVEREGLRVVAQGDSDYPTRLLAIDMPPPALFVRGSLAALASDHVVGVVGTRRPSPAGRRIASRIATALARAEATVVSGLAIGIDGAAHAAAVAEGSPTIAFIGGGHGRLFPRAHDRLADAIVEGGGAVLSEYAPMTEPSKGTFPQRNRLISGSTDAVVVVEAGASSGALLTASWALEQGRECFLVPGSIDSPMSAGCNGFLREWGGAARVVSGIPQLLDDLGLFGAAALEGGSHEGAPLQPPDAGRPASPGGVVISPKVRLPTVRSVLSGRDPAQKAVGEAIVHGAVTADELVAVTRHTLGEVLRALTRLEASGLVLARRGRYEPLGALAGASPNRKAA
ncbi:MAG TPA: DNA-processing protein DprA [Candidatus Limnocylindrales bacterium]|nr:DNA-processing protein DprA [Candidatus Limnocylindrales bacterium]